MIEHERSPLRLPLILIAITSLLAAMWAGLIRIGWDYASWQPDLAQAHGALMVSGFLGTVIGLERAVAAAAVYKNRLLYIVPLLAGAGGLLLLTGWNNQLGVILMTLGSLGLMFLFGLIARHHKALHTAVMLLGAVSWFIGNLLWLTGKPIHIAVWWWASFLVLTIAGERLELSRIVRLTKMQTRMFGGFIVLMFIGLTISALPYRYDLGVRINGLSYILLALWLLRYDIARRTIKGDGLVRYIAACLLSGYVWLGISGALALYYGGVSAGPLYDAMLHSVFLGFVMAMIFGHAPIIFPAVLGLPVIYRPIFYSQFALLHISLIIRIIGDLSGNVALREWGGMLNVIALLVFLGNTAYSIISGKFKKNG